MFGPLGSLLGLIIWPTARWIAIPYFWIKDRFFQ